MITEVYYNAVSTINYSRIKVLQFGGLKETSIAQMDIRDTMTKLRNNPFDKAAPNAAYCDMIILWRGASGFAVLSANDKRYPSLAADDYMGFSVMNKFKKDSSTLCWLENRPYIKRFPLQNGAFANIWEKPFRLKAMTGYDMDYGDKWYWNYGVLESVDEGNKYGDTSDFFIFGMIEDRPNRFRKQLKW